jgi:hypothetical protein
MTLEALVREYIRDLRRNSSGGDDYPWEWAKGTADYLETLLERAHTCDVAQGSLTQEDIYANCWTTLIGFSEELTERDRKFICDQVARKVILAAKPPAAPVETDDVTAALNARQAAINEMMARPSSSAANGGELDFNDPLTSKIMGAARLHTHDHTMAYSITREVLSVVRTEPQAVSVPVDQVARTIALSYGRDPDALTEWTEMCDANNRPVPIWRVYEEQAEALLATYSITRPEPK